MSVETRAEERQPGAASWRAAARRRLPEGVSRQLIADLALLLVTLVWGSTFVTVKSAVAAYPVFSFLAIRFGFAALALLPLAALDRRRGRGEPLLFPAVTTPAGRSQVVRSAAGPVLVGLALFAGYSLQTMGLHLTTPAKAGFITGLSVVIVPLAAALLLRQSPPRAAWVGVALATGGLAFLSWQPGARLNPGDLLVLGCAVGFASHILLTGRFAARSSPLWLTLGQILTVAVLSAVAALLWESRPALTAGVVGAAAFTGVLATSVAFGVQTLAQRFTTATHTALIFSAEPVFAALAGLLLAGEALGPRQIAGCALILAGMLAAENRWRPWN